MVLENTETRNVIIPIIAAIIAALITVTFGILSDQHYFQAYPDYQVFITSKVNSDIQFEQFSVQNIGTVQAKNAEIIITSGDPISFHDKFCFEGSIKNKTTDTYKIKFEKISTNIPCFIDFKSSVNKKIEGVMILSDDAPGRIYFSKESDKKSLGNVTTFTFSSSQDSINNLNSLGTLGIVLEVTAFGISAFYQYSRKQKFLNKQRKLEKETKEEIIKLEEELTFYLRLSITNKDASIQIQDRMNWLQEQIISKQRELDEIESKIITSPKYQHLIEKFFINWSLLEQELFRIIERYRLNVGGKPTIMHIITELKEKEILSNKMIEIFYIVKDFRNTLVHGDMKGNVKLLKQINENLDVLIEMIRKNDRY